MNTFSQTTKHTHAHTQFTARGTGDEEGKLLLKPICECALKVLQDLYNRIVSGDIYIHEVQKVHSMETLMFQLYSTTVIDGKHGIYLPTAKTIVTKVDQRFKEYQQFLVYRQQLSHMLFFLKPEPLPGNFVKPYLYTIAHNYICMHKDVIGKEGQGAETPQIFMLVH